MKKINWPPRVYYVVLSVPYLEGTKSEHFDIKVKRLSRTDAVSPRTGWVLYGPGPLLLLCEEAILA